MMGIHHTILGFIRIEYGTGSGCRPTPAFSGAAGDLHKPARLAARHDRQKSRPAQGPRQRRPLQSTVGRRRIGIERRSGIVGIFTRGK